MRDALRRVYGAPAHAGLAYDVWAPFDADGKVDESERDRWLERVVGTRAPRGYADAYARFRSSLLAEPGAQGVEGRVEGRLLIGHGNASPVDIGLTVHHTWGMPLIPGSALKGLLSHYLEAVFGPIDGEDDPDRRGFRAADWHGNRLVAAPGKWHRALFGAPDVPGEAVDPAIEDGVAYVGAAQGRVVFHDALFVPDSVEQPFARDVLTVHQRRYYGQGGGTRGGVPPWPSDHDDPNPVPFLTVRPGAGFLVALTGDPTWAAFAMAHLQAALVEWGIGGKTVAGYGRFADDWKPAFTVEEKVAESKVSDFLDWIEGQRQAKTPQRALLAAVEEAWLDGLYALADPDERKAAARAIGRVIKNRKLAGRVGEIRAALET